MLLHSVLQFRINELQQQMTNLRDFANSISPAGLSWAHDSINWTLDDWKTTVWSDEVCFQLVRADGRICVWHRPLEAMDPGCQQSTAQAVAGYIMVCTVFIWNGLGPLVQMNWSLPRNDRVWLHGNHLQLPIDFINQNNDGTFIDDKAPCHQITSVYNCFKEHSGQ